MYISTMSHNVTLFRSASITDTPVSRLNFTNDINVFSPSDLDLKHRFSLFGCTFVKGNGQNIPVF